MLEWDAETMSPRTALSFCETVTAGPLSPWHIRQRPADEPLKPGGGVFTTALCDRNLNGGWDIENVEVTTETLDRLQDADRNRPGVCLRCAVRATPIVTSRPPARR